jgi:hypothetical protein
MLSFKNFIHEQNIHGISRFAQTVLDRANPRKIDRLISNLTLRGAESGISMDYEIGSSRTYFPIKQPQPITIDGKKHPVKTGLKVTRFKSFGMGDEKYGLDRHYGDEYHDEGGHTAGQLQTLVTQRRAIQKHSVLLKKKDGTYKYNPNGIVAPTLSHAPDGSWEHTLHVEPFDELSATHASRLRSITKTKELPDGMNMTNLMHAVRKSNNALPQHKDHPLVKRLQDFHKKANIDPEDFGLENTGFWQHPDTGKYHLLVIDAGASPTLMKSRY